MKQEPRYWIEFVDRDTKEDRVSQLYSSSVNCLRDSLTELRPGESSTVYKYHDGIISALPSQSIEWHQLPDALVVEKLDTFAWLNRDALKGTV